MHECKCTGVARARLRRFLTRAPQMMWLCCGFGFEEHVMLLLVWSWLWLVVCVRLVDWRLETGVLRIGELLKSMVWFASLVL